MSLNGPTIFHQNWPYEVYHYTTTCTCMIVIHDCYGYRTCNTVYTDPPTSLKSKRNEKRLRGGLSPSTLCDLLHRWVHTVDKHICGYLKHNQIHFLNQKRQSTTKGFGGKLWILGEKEVTIGQGTQ